MNFINKSLSVLFFTYPNRYLSPGKDNNRYTVDPCKNLTEVVLRDGWRFLPGDNQVYDQPGFDASEWAANNAE